MLQVVVDVACHMLERAERKTDELCRAYGGSFAHDGRVRICTKNRWHSDSHAYEFVAMVGHPYPTRGHHLMGITRWPNTDGHSPTVFNAKD